MADTFENFRRGLADGHEVGRTHDVLYAVGFVAGFIWGALTTLREAKVREYEELPRRA